MPDTLTLRRPDDWHVHLRDGAMLEAVLPATARDFARAIIMPNLGEPVTTLARLRAYRARILKALPAHSDFEPLMTLYLTQATDPGEVRAGFASGDIVAAKLYPAGATTNSEAGVRDIEAIYPVLETMAEIGMPLLVHGEVVDEAVDVFDREAVFLERILAPLVARLPQLRVVLEHVTTAQGVAFVRDGGENIGATITAHHLAINRNAMFAGGLRPHNYCLPVVKREAHRQALLRAVTAGPGKFFLGTDSAPHPDSAKLAPCGCAGIYSAPVALALVTQIFDDAGALDRLEAFTSLNGAAFYRRAPNEARVVLKKCAAPQPLAPAVLVGGETVTVFDPAREIFWRRRSG
ncbi:MAG: dihydroorotase [Alphaproteobacteria bacterium]